MAITTSIYQNQDTDARFRTWCQFIHDGLSAAGWVQTADTGQINLATVTVPTSTNQSKGYEIWGTNDGGGKQVWYLKIEYGSGGGATNIPSIWITIGTGSNGSGTLTGQTNTRTQCGGGSSTSSSYDCMISGGTSWIACAMFSNTSSAYYTFGFVVERTKNSSGVDTDTGMYVIGFGYTQPYGYSQCIPKTGTIFASEGIACVNPGTNINSTRISGTQCAVYPIFPAASILYPACLGAVAFYYADISTGTTLDITRYGSSHTYQVVRSGAGGTSAPGSLSYFSLAIRYE